MAVVLFGSSPLQMRSAYCWYGTRGTWSPLGKFGSPTCGAQRKSLRCTTTLGWTMPAPALPRYVAAQRIAEEDTFASSAATTCAAVLVSAPVASVARLTVIARPLTLTESGELGAPGFTNCIVTWLPFCVGSLSSWPYFHVLRTTAAACTVVPVQVDGVANPAGDAPGAPGSCELPGVAACGVQPIEAMAFRRYPFVLNASGISCVRFGYWLCSAMMSAVPSSGV